MASRSVALITGASRGIGAATARELARRGYALALTARSADALAALVAELQRGGCQALAIPADLCAPAAAETIVNAAHDHFGRVDVLINNAGVGSGGRTISHVADEDIERMMATNLHAPIALTRAILPSMIERRSGAIIFVASIAAHIGLPTSVIYAASKFGLRGFAIGLRREVARCGVHVTLVSPGFIDTDMAKALGGTPKAPPELVAKTIARALTHPRREFFVPRYYRLAIWLDRACPGFFDWALGRLASRRYRDPL